MDSNTEILEEGSEESVETKDTGKKRKPLSTNALLVVVIILLVLQTVLTGFNTVNGFIKDQQETARIAKITTEVAGYAAGVEGVSRQMLDNYKKDIYNNESVDSLGKQQVLATEYTFMGLMLISQQNAKLIQTITQLK